jgi:hypothetical protein
MNIQSLEYIPGWEPIQPFHAVQVSADRSFQLIDPEPIAPKEHFPTGRLEQDGDVASIKTRAGSV